MPTMEEPDANRHAMLPQECAQTTSLGAVGHAWTFHGVGLERGTPPLQAHCLKQGNTKLCYSPPSFSIPWILRYLAQGIPALIKGQCSFPNELVGCSRRETALGLWLSQAKEGAASRAPHSSLNFPNISSQCVGDRQRSHTILTILLPGLL